MCSRSQRLQGSTPPTSANRRRRGGDLRHDFWLQGLSLVAATARPSKGFPETELLSAPPPEYVRPCRPTALHSRSSIAKDCNAALPSSHRSRYQPTSSWLGLRALAIVAWVRTRTPPYSRSSRIGAASSPTTSKATPSSSTAWVRIARKVSPIASGLLSPAEPVQVARRPKRRVHPSHEQHRALEDKSVATGHQAYDAFGTSAAASASVWRASAAPVGELVEPARGTHDCSVPNQTRERFRPIRWAAKSLSRIMERAPSSSRAWARWVLVMGSTRILRFFRF